MSRRFWNKITGATKAKRAIAKAAGIPTTKGGRRAKIGRMFRCATLLAVGLSVTLATVAVAATLR